MPMPHHKLVAWQRADEFFIIVHRVTHQNFPREERYELGTQIRRSAYSVAANIVEGNSRDGARDTLRFFNFASASLSETGYGLHVAHRLGYLSDTTYEALDLQLRATAAPLYGLIRQKRSKLAARALASGGMIVVGLLQLLRWW